MSLTVHPIGYKPPSINFNHSNFEKARKRFLEYRRPLKLFPLIISFVYTVIAILYYITKNHHIFFNDNTFFMSTLLMQFLISSVFILHNILNTINRTHNIFIEKICKQLNNLLLDIGNKIEDNFLLY